jgi:hypothetical protein
MSTPNVPRGPNGCPPTGTGPNPVLAGGCGRARIGRCRSKNPTLERNNPSRRTIPVYGRDC